MLLKIENLGPIKKGTIDLRKELTILTGPNNTGKSYLTYLVYGVNTNSAMLSLLEVFNTLSPIFEKSESINLAIKNGKSISVSETIDNHLEEISKVITNITKSNFVKIFASSSINPTIQVEVLRPESGRYSGTFDTLIVSNNELHGIRDDGYVEKKAFNSMGVGPSENDVYLKLAYVLSIYSNLYIERGPIKNIYFFPAERTAINLFAKHIVSAKAETKDELDTELISGLTSQQVANRLQSQVNTGPKYPYAIRDYINFVNDFKRGENEGEFAAIATNIELALAGGSIHIDDFDQLGFTPKGSKASLELHLSSSLVKSLSYLILYLRYTATAGDQIIIDEPELNLHPDLQIAIAKAIAQMVNAGLKVIISTHSDYLIKELNNLILLGELNKQEQHQAFVHEKGFAPDELLTKEQVGAYFLHDGTIDPIDLDENGLAVPTINEAIRQVDGLAEEIYMEMEG